MSNPYRSAPKDIKYKPTLFDKLKCMFNKHNWVSEEVKHKVASWASIAPTRPYKVISSGDDYLEATCSNCGKTRYKTIDTSLYEGLQ
jgi:NADH:ubiquinone oxidoreductase subunit E